jgi:hypothetical protein
MNCSEIRDRLPALIYGHLPADEVRQVQAHLAVCDACRGQAAALQQVRGALDVLPVPLVQVDVARLHRETAARQERRLRRWRRLTLVACAAAALIGLLAASSHWEMRIEAHQLVLRWGSAPLVPERPIPTPPRPEPLPVPQVQEVAPPANPDVEDRLRLLSALVQALAEEAKQREGQRKEEIAALQEQIRDLSQYLAQARQATDKDLAAVYAVLFPEKTKGQTP